MSRPLHLCEILEEEHAALYPTDRRRYSWSVEEKQIQNAAVLSRRCKTTFQRDFSQDPTALAVQLTELVQCSDVLTAQYPGLARTLSKPLQQVIDDNDDASGEEVEHLNRLIVDEVGEDAVTPGPRARLEAYVRMVHQPHKDNENTSALCISGGGIRSATFALGVLQSLARRNLLDKFDFISTVSGGGYIGSWLSSWIRRHRDGARGVAAELAHAPADPLQPQPPPVTHLREYSNYLTPRLGMMSGDTWAVIATYVRNLLLNWAILIPAMLVLVLLPRIAAAIDFGTPLADLRGGTAAVPLVGPIVGWIVHFGNGDWLLAFSQRVLTSNVTAFIRNLQQFKTISYVLTGTLLLAVGLFYIGWNRPADNRYRGRRTTSDKSFTVACLLPLIGGAVMLSAAWVRDADYRATNGMAPHYPVTAAWIISLMPLFILAIHLINFFRVDAAARRMNIAAEVRQGRVARTAKKIFYEVVAAGVAGYLSHLMLRFLAMNVFPLPSAIGTKPLYVTFAVPCILLALYLSASIFVGLSSEVNEDWDREWWSRCGGWVLAGIVGWPLLSGTIIFGPAVFRWRPEWIASIGSIVSVATIFLGRSRKSGQTPRDERSPVADIAARALAPAAILFIFATLSLGTSKILGSLCNIQHIHEESDYHTTVLCGTRLSDLLMALIAILTVAAVGGIFIGVNTASMHAMYRNRLIRAYLGASRGTRDPNPFTGFDPHDNFALQLLRPELLWLTSFIDFPAFYRDLCHSNHPFSRNLRAAIERRRHGILASNAGDESVREALFQVLNCVMEEEDFAEFLDEPPNGAKRTAVDKFRAVIDRVVRFIAREQKLKARRPHLLRHNRRLLEKHFPHQIYPYRTPLLTLADIRDPVLLKNALTGTAFGIQLMDEIKRRKPADRWDDVLQKLPQPDHLRRVVDALNLLLTSISLNKFKEHIVEELPQPVDYQAVRRNRRLLNAELIVPDDVVRPDGASPKGELVLQDMSLPRPMHVINCALNLVAGKNLAWQERKADTFTFSPLHSGSYRLGYRSTVEYGGDTGLTLGTAMTISGAAASPNMGYHSSASLAFLMTLFNVRLGWWLGNPGVSGKWSFRRSSPFNALWPLLVEALGKTNDEYSYVYLSDGGHFENLGLYEMVLRRRKFILVTDAGCDPQHQFDDLGNAIRKIRTDFGIPIEMQEPMYIYPRGVDEPGGKYCATGKIRYSCVDDGAPDGVLLYIKPAVYLNEPKDIYNYAKRNHDFPHETTANQFFSESQFESYRMLGSHVIDDIIAKARERLIKARETAKNDAKDAVKKGSLEERLLQCDAETWVPRSLAEFFDVAAEFYIGASTAAEAGHKVTVQDGSRVTLTIRPQADERLPLHPA